MIVFTPVESEEAQRIPITAKRYARLLHMVNDVQFGGLIRVNIRLAHLFQDMGIIRLIWKAGPNGPYFRVEFTPYGWLVANRPEHWEIPHRKTSDMHVAARRWKRHVPELQARRLAEKGAQSAAPKPVIPGLKPPDAT